MTSHQNVESVAVLTARSISKRYGQALALENVDFDLRRGEIHALLGENGAGKSTLMKVLSGLTPPASGEIRLNDVPVRFSGPEAAARSGIGMVHQHFLLVPAFTVLENLALDDSSRRPSLVRDDTSVVSNALSVMNRLGWTIPLNRRVSDLPVGTQQRIEILKTLLADANILLFDEPTAVLSPNEIDGLFTVLSQLREEGRSIVFVSHKLGEVISICDRVTVLRRGKNAGTVSIRNTDTFDLARRMVGQSGASLAVNSRHSTNIEAAEISRNTVLELSGITTSRTNRDVLLKDINLALNKGEILGIAGVDGNGQTELAELLTGSRSWSAGTLSIGGTILKSLAPSDLVRFGIGYIPPDRQREGLALTLTVSDNLALDLGQVPKFCHGQFLNFRALKSFAAETSREFDIRAESLDLPVASLSGGNQQKVVIARALWKNPEILIAVSPTRGLDVAAAAYVHAQLLNRRDKGGAILLISTDLDEVIALSDQIGVLYEGRIVGMVTADSSRNSGETERPTVREQIGLMMGGHNFQGENTEKNLD